MTVSQREQYLSGRVIVDAPRSSAVHIGEPAGAAPHRDLRQAEYYQDVLAELRAAVNEELSHHCAARAEHEQNDNAVGMRRCERFIRAKESELATIDELMDALRCRFPTSGLT